MGESVYLPERQNHVCCCQTRQGQEGRQACRPPPYASMITAAIKGLKDKKGSSRQAILKYIVANNKVDAAKAGVRVKLALRKMVAAKKVVAAAAAGKKGAGSFKLPAKEPKAKKPAAKKAKKPKAAKPKAAKKPAAKKAKKPAEGRQAKGCQEARSQEGGEEASQEGRPQEEVDLRTAISSSIIIHSFTYP